ncbi:MAG: hypothetical protein D6767_09145 [Candidatus Hydrogenedentota bacterium]|nr:MAG: hypothetical protein D6767_09145 [Candidatus Hydrogenedentota bacterium]
MKKKFLISSVFAILLIWIALYYAMKLSVEPAEIRKVVAKVSGYQMEWQNFEVSPVWFFAGITLQNVQGSPQNLEKSLFKDAVLLNKVNWQNPASTLWFSKPAKIKIQFAANKALPSVGKISHKKQHALQKKWNDFLSQKRLVFPIQSFGIEISANQEHVKLLNKAQYETEIGKIQITEMDIDWKKQTILLKGSLSLKQEAMEEFWQKSKQSLEKELKKKIANANKRKKAIDEIYKSLKQSVQKGIMFTIAKQEKPEVQWQASMFEVYRAYLLGTKRIKKRVTETSKENTSEESTNRKEQTQKEEATTSTTEKQTTQSSTTVTESNNNTVEGSLPQRDEEEDYEEESRLRY